MLLDAARTIIPWHRHTVSLRFIHLLAHESHLTSFVNDILDVPAGLPLLILYNLAEIQFQIIFPLLLGYVVSRFNGSDPRWSDLILTLVFIFDDMLAKLLLKRSHQFCNLLFCDVIGAIVAIDHKCFNNLISYRVRRWLILLGHSSVWGNMLRRILLLFWL